MGTSSIYLDNCATTPMDPRTAEAMMQVLVGDFGNPSSIHDAGRRAARRLAEARQVIADKLGARSTEIVFTASGTEANNLAIGGVVAHALRLSRHPVHIISTTTEHASVSRRLDYEKRLHGDAVEITTIGVDINGHICFDELLAAVRPDTRLVTLLHTNNETGSMQDLEIMKKFKLQNPTIPLHVDVVQSFCKVNLDVRLLPVDLLTICAHKVHGPKGIGALFIRAGVDLEPLLVGGGQEKFRRAGTENVAAAVGFAEAVKNAPQAAAYRSHLHELESGFFAFINRYDLGYTINGPSKPEQGRMPGLFNISFPGGISREDLQIGLDLQGVQASSASACHSGVVADSHVLTAMGVDSGARQSCIRIAFSRMQSADTAERAGDAVGRTVQHMQRVLANKVS